MDFSKITPVNPHASNGTPSGEPTPMPNVNPSRSGEPAPMPTTPYGRPGTNPDDIPIDLSNVDVNSGGNRYVAPGRHLAYVSNIEYSTSKAGNPMLVWDVTVYQGEYQGIKKQIWTVLSPNALWKVHEMAEAVGYPLGESKRFTVGELRAQALNTFVVANVVDDGEYNGSPRTKLQGCEAPTAYNIEPGTKLPKAGVPS